MTNINNKPFTLFDFPKLLMGTNKIPWDNLTQEQQKLWSTFMINRIFSMNNSFIGLSHVCSQYGSNIPSKLIYKIYTELLPNKYSWFKYIAKKKKENKNKNFTPKLIEFLANELELSTREIELYIEYIDGLEVEEFLLNYGLTFKDFK